MSSFTTSPRSSKATESASHGPHSHIRQTHPALVQQSPVQASPAVMSAEVIPLSPMVDGQKQTTPPLSPAGYFGFMTDSTESIHGQHSKKNWSPASSSIRSAAARSPLQIQLENPSTPFLKQAEVLAQKLHRQNSSRKLHRPANDVLLDGHASNPTENIRRDVIEPRPVFPRLDNDYFSSNQNHLSIVTKPSESAWSHLSNTPSLDASPHLPGRGISKPTHSKLSPSQRSSQYSDPVFISCQQLSELLGIHNKSNLLLLDVRTYKLFAESRISSAVNLCIPTTLLKRPSFNVSKLSETFASQSDKEIFGKWKAMEFIIVYDGDSKDTHDTSGMTALHTLSKFSREGWRGHAYILKGRHWFLF